MIDFISVSFNSDDTSFLLEHKELNFRVLVSIRDGDELENFYKADYKGLEFTVYQSARIELKGSLHKYWNDGQHNYNDFTYSDLLSVLDDLQFKFSLELDQCLLHGFEYAVNVETEFNPDVFLRSIIHHNYRPFKDFKEYNASGKRMEVDEYALKIYNKSKQYKLPNNILRIENKTKKSRAKLACGVKTLLDLTDIDVHYKLAEQLKSTFAELLIDDKSLRNQLTRTEEKTMSCSREPSWWTHHSNKDQKRRTTKRFRQIIEAKANVKYQPLVAGLMREKLMKLTSIDEPILD